MILENHERDKFALWCDRQAESAELIGKQLEKLNWEPQLVEQMTNRERMTVVACKFVAELLRSGETMTIGPTA